MRTLNSFVVVSEGEKSEEVKEEKRKSVNIVLYISNFVD